MSVSFLVGRSRDSPVVAIEISIYATQAMTALLSVGRLERSS
jgi:hypothetical protein